MSHFSILVHLPADTPLRQVEKRIEALMERYDESREVALYKDFEKGSPAEFWWVGAMRKAIEQHKNGTGLREYDPDFLGVSSARTSEPSEQQRARIAEEARIGELLGESPSWELVVRLYNEMYHPGNELVTAASAALADPDEVDRERLNYDPETGRAFTWSTRNPEGLWDYWRIGGRWGEYFPVKQEGPGLITTPSGRGWDSPKPKQGHHVDGGPKRLLDLEAMRALEEAKAEAQYGKWEDVVSVTPPARSWRDFVSLVELGEMKIGEAREQYVAQPRIMAAKGAGIADMWGECPVGRFKTTREEYLAQARNAAVPGYALLTPEGEWIAAGRMGWFGMSSEGADEKALYQKQVNQYLDEKVADDDLLIILDAHV